MKGNKSESRGNDQHHFMDDGNKAESLSWTSQRRGTRELQDHQEVPREAAVLSTWWLSPHSPAPARGGCSFATASSAESSWLKKDNIKMWLVTAIAVGRRTPVCISFLGEEVSFLQPGNQPLTDQNYPEWSLLEFAKTHNLKSTYSLWKCLFPEQLLWGTFLARACWLLTLTEAAWSNALLRSVTKQTALFPHSPTL